MRRLTTAAAAGTSILALSSLLHPYGNVKAARARESILAGAQITPQAGAVIRRACRNCHSEETEWPWYSYLPPLSWMVEHDVAEAREHLNLSRWSAYSAEQRTSLLTRIGAEVRARQMPLPKYLRLHPGARLSGADIRDVYDWTRAERARARK